MIEISNSDFEFLTAHLGPIARKFGTQAQSDADRNHARRMLQIAKKWNRKK